MRSRRIINFWMLDLSIQPIAHGSLRGCFHCRGMINARLMHPNALYQTDFANLIFYNPIDAFGSTGNISHYSYAIVRCVHKRLNPFLFYLIVKAVYWGLIIFFQKWREYARCKDSTTFLCILVSGSKIRIELL